MASCNNICNNDRVMFSLHKRNCGDRKKLQPYSKLWMNYNISESGVQGKLEARTILLV